MSYKKLLLSGTILSVFSFLLLTGCFGPFARRSPRWERRYARPVTPAREMDARDIKREEEDLPDEVERMEEVEEEDTMDFEEFRRQITEAYRTGDYEWAIELLEERLELDPDQTSVLFNLGSLHYRLGNFRQARNYYRRVVELEPQDIEARKYLGASHYQLGQWDEAAREFERVLELDPQRDEVRSWLNQIR